MKTFPDFGKELRGPFMVDEQCFDCAELYHGRNATPENSAAHCADRLRLPDVMRGTCGQTFLLSRMQDPTEPRIRLVAAAPVQVQAQPKNSPASRPAPARARRKPAAPRIGPRLCGCGAILPKGKRLCDACGQRAADRPIAGTCGATWNSGARRHPARTQACHFLAQQRTLRT